MKTIGFIGGGRITKIFLQAFEKNSITFERISVFDTNPTVLNALKSRFTYISVSSVSLEEASGSDLILIALHPPVLLEALLKAKEFINNNAVIVSLAPKITIEKISETLPGFVNVARMNPSASSVVGKGVNPIVFGPNMPEENINALLAFFQPLGFTPQVEEAKIEAYAVISAMGHTYFFFQLQKLKELALRFGMDDKEAQTAIAEMLAGTSETLFKSGLPYDEVANMVPVKPLADVEDTVKGYYDQYLHAIFNKIKPL